MRGVYPSSNPVHLESSRGGQQDRVWSLPAGFKVLSLVASDPNAVSHVIGVGDDRVSPLVSVGLGQRLPDFLLDQLECLQVSLKRGGIGIVRNILVKELNKGNGGSM